MNINNFFYKISYLIDIGNYEEAKENCKKLEKYKNDNIIKSNLAGFYIDIGDRSKNELLIKKGIEYLEELEDHKKILTNYYYNLGNGYADLYKAKISNNFKEAFNCYKNYGRKAIFNYKKAIKDKKTKNKDMAFINLGNSYNTIGRKLDSYISFIEALKINPNNVMGKSNIGLFYFHLIGFLEDDPICRYYVKKAIDYFENAKGYYLEPTILNDINLKLIKLKNYESGDCPIKFEIEKLEEYQKILGDNWLMISPCIFCKECLRYFKDDFSYTLFIPNFEEDVMKYRDKAFQEFKNVHINAKELLLEGIQLLINGEDDKGKQKVKTSNKEFYSLFDKIAYYLYKEFNININKEFNVGFFKSQFWEEGNIIRNEFIETKNYFILGLYDIFLDVTSKEHDKFYKDLKFSRQKFEHKIIFNEKNEDNIFEETFQMGKWASSAIINVLFLMNHQSYLDHYKPDV
jgi:hypothetical protein